MAEEKIDKKVKKEEALKQLTEEKKAKQPKVKKIKEEVKAKDYHSMGDEEKAKEYKKLKNLKIKVPALLMSIKSLSTLLKAGIPLSETMDTISGQSSDENLNNIYSYMSSEVRRGSNLADVMRLFPKTFPETISSVVEAGEKGGSLENNLLFISETIQKEWEVSKKLKGAVVYPAIVIGMVGVMFIAMIFFVFPKLELMFEAFENIPELTKKIMAGAGFIRTNWMPIFGAIAVLVIVFIIFLRTKSGKKFSAWLAIHFPILKNLFKANILSSFSRTLSVLLASGIPLEKAMAITTETTNNYIYAESFKEICGSIAQGNNLSISLSDYPNYFNKSFVKMIDIGEVSGSLEENLMYLHDFYAEEVDEMSENLVTLIQPILLIFVGALIGGLALLVLMPIYQLMGSING